MEAVHNYQTGQLEESANKFWRVLDYERVVEHGHGSIFVSKICLSMILIKSIKDPDLSVVETLLTEVLDTTKVHSKSIVFKKIAYAGKLIEQGNDHIPDAERILTDAMEEMKLHLKYMYDLAIRAATFLAEIYVGYGKLENFRHLKDDLLKKMQTTFGEEHENVLWLMDEIAKTLNSFGEMGESGKLGKAVANMPFETDKISSN